MRVWGSSAPDRVWQRLRRGDKFASGGPGRGHRIFLLLCRPDREPNGREPVALREPFSRWFLLLGPSRFPPTPHPLTSQLVFLASL